MKNRGALSEVKRRLVEGVSIQMVEHPLATLSVRVAETMGLIRTVAKVQTNAVAFRMDGRDELSWLSWPKANHVRLTSDGFEVCLYEDGSFRKKMRYEWR